MLNKLIIKILVINYIMNFPKERNENNESFDNILNNQTIKEKLGEEDDDNNLSPIFTKEFEKIFCPNQTQFKNNNDIDSNSEKSNGSIEVMIKTIEANLISLEKEINNLNILETDLEHVNILNHLNEIYESENSTINERIKALKLQEKLMDKLISWINEKINDFS